MFKFTITVFALCLTVIWAYDGPAIVSQDQNILRSYGNLGQVSTFSKTLDTPFTSVRKSDVRISNPGALIARPTAAYTNFGYPGLVSAAPVVHQSYNIPTLSHASYIKPGFPATPITTAYHSLPTVGNYPAPSYVTKTAGPVGTSLLGVQYSAAPTVSHMSFSNGLGLTYEW